MATEQFTLRGDYVEVNQLLKLVGLCDSGGIGKQMVAEGIVRLNGKVERRKTAKVRAGDVVICGDVRIVVNAADD